MNAPCYKCKDRVVGCHSTCVNYKKYKDKTDKNKEIRTREIKTDYDIRSIKIDFGSRNRVTNGISVRT